jgi:hypothetical protein
LNGTTPCGCFPGNTLVSDTLFVSHPVNLTAHINASTTSKIQVGGTGSISNALFNVTISNSIVLAEGNLNIKKLTINSGGVFQLKNSILMINASSDIYGLLQADNADIQFLAGNIQVFPTGNIQMTNGSHMHFTNGGYRNDGLTSLCASCCISSDKGSLQNVAGATFTGSGAVLINSGTLKNFGSWPSSITWCASGADVGMTSAENCSLSDQICTFGPLASDLLTFEGTFTESCIELFWVTANYLMPLNFLVEHLQPSSAWKKLEGAFTVEELESVIRYRMLTDCTLQSGSVFRLTAFDNDGQRVFVAHTSVEAEASPGARLYPNPSEEYVTIDWNPDMHIERIEVEDYLGRKIADIDVKGIHSTSFPSPDLPGIYRVTLVGGHPKELKWVVL